MPPIKKRTKVKFKVTDEERRLYQKYIDKQSVKLRLSVDERTYLEIKMREDGWSNMSGYIRYKLFGNDVKKRLMNKLKRAEIKDIFTYIYNAETLLADREDDYFSRIGTLIKDAEANGPGEKKLIRIQQYLYLVNARVLKSREELINELSYLIELYEHNSNY